MREGQTSLSEQIVVQFKRGAANPFGGQHARRRYRVRRYVGRDRPNGPSMGRLTLNVLLSLIESPTLRFSSSFFGRRTKELDDPKVSTLHGHAMG